MSCHLKHSGEKLICTSYSVDNFIHINQIIPAKSEISQTAGAGAKAPTLRIDSEALPDSADGERRQRQPRRLIPYKTLKGFRGGEDVRDGKMHQPTPEEPRQKRRRERHASAANTLCLTVTVVRRNFSA